MFGIGGVEFILILLFVFIVFGADRLPEIARVIGKAIAKFRKAQAEMNAAIQTDVKNLETDEQPFQKSVEAFDKFGKETVDTVKSTVKATQKTNATPGAVAVAATTTEKAETAKAAATATAGAGAATAVAAKTQTANAKPAVEKAPAEAKPATTGTVRQESFTERKARYEAERAAKAAAAAAASTATASEAVPAAAEAAAASAPQTGEGE